MLSGAEWKENCYLIWPEKADAPQQAAAVSWSDWLVFFDASSGVPGVRFILNEMASSGIREVWWRTFGGGHALYPSKVPGVTRGNYSGQGADFSKFDSLKEAVSYGHKLGLKVYAWFTPLEEAHAVPDAVRSFYIDNHPEFKDRNMFGAELDSLSFFYPEYRNYKAALAKEMLDYGVDGIVLDFERGGSPALSNFCGYIPDAVKAFNEKYHQTGIPQPNNLDWVRYRAAWMGDLIKRIAADAHARKPKADFGLLYESGKELSVRCDMPSFADDPAVDFICAIGKTNRGWGNFADDPAKDKLAQKKLFANKKGSLALYCLNESVEKLAAKVASHRKALDSIVWFETTYLHWRRSYWVPRQLALPEEAELSSPTLDFGKGGEVQLTAAGDWSLYFNEQKIAEGKADHCNILSIPPKQQTGKLRIVCRLPHRSAKGGVALQGFAVKGNGEKKSFASDRSWTSPQGNVLTIGQPGIPPFLAPPDRAVEGKAR